MTAADVRGLANSEVIMDVNEALRIAAMYLRAIAKGDDREALIDLASNVCYANEVLTRTKGDLLAARQGADNLALQLKGETDRRWMEKDRADKAEARNSEYRTAINDGERQLAQARKQVRELRKKLRAAKGGG